VTYALQTGQPLSNLKTCSRRRLLFATQHKAGTKGHRQRSNHAWQLASASSLRFYGDGGNPGRADGSETSSQLSGQVKTIGRPGHPAGGGVVVVVLAVTSRRTTAHDGRRAGSGRGPAYRARAAAGGEHGRISARASRGPQLLPPSCRFRFSCHKFDSICR